MKKLMFEIDDIKSVRDHLVKLMRIIFYKRKITQDDFVEKHTAYFNRTNLPPFFLNHDKNNLRRTLNDPEKLTFKRMLHVLANILYLDIIRVSITVKDPTTGDEVTYSSDDKV